MPPARNPEQRAAAKAADADFDELYKIIMKEKNAGFDTAVAIIGRLSVERLNKLHKTGIFILEKAVRMKSLRIIEALLQKGVSVATRDPGPGTTYLYDAACVSTEMVKLFLNRGIDINGGIHPALVGAAGNNKSGIEIATLLLANGADINRVGTGGMNALMVACESNNKKMVEFLLANGADVNVIGPKNRTVLFFANKPNNTSLDIFKMLLAKGVDINTVDTDGKNVLLAHFDSIAYPDFVKFVKNKGLRLDSIDAQGNNLLHFCLKNALKNDALFYFETAKMLIENGVDINVRNNNRQTPLLYSLVSSFRETEPINFMKEALLLPGIDINLDGNDAAYGAATIQNISPLNVVANLSWNNSLKKLVEAGADLDYHDSLGKTALMYIVASEKTTPALIDYIIARPGVDINKQNPINGMSPLHYAVRVLSNPNLLIERGANVNSKDIKGFTPVLHAAYFGMLDTLETLLKLPTVDKDILYNVEVGVPSKTLLDLAYHKGGFPKAGINEKIIEFCVDKSELWQGWSRANASQFDSIFAVDKKEAADSSCCPICLKTVVRSDGCVYIQGHNCSRLDGFYHKALYDKYKNELGTITWCTICGRICSGHRHYALGYSKSAKPDLLLGKNPFTTDCRTEGGGGELEKLARYRRMREYALEELQDKVGKIRSTVALERLVEEMWNAPIGRREVFLAKMLENKTWNHPTSAFPLPPANVPVPEVDMSTLPNIRIPEADRVELAPTVVQGTDTIMGDEGAVIQFHHRQSEGGLFRHDNNFISAESLAMFINDQNGKYKTDESFGLCWSYPGMCNGRLYPEEIERFFVDESDAAHDAELKATFADYKKKFNWKFRVRLGGKHSSKSSLKRSSLKRSSLKRSSLKRKPRSNNQKLRISRKGLRKQNGGEPKNVFVPATNAQCYLPSSKKNNTKKNNQGLRPKLI